MEDMYLKQLFLQNFRSYAKSEFSFSPGTTLIVGPNTSGKSNIIEAIYLLSTGKSFRAERDVQMIQFNKETARVTGRAGEEVLEVFLATVPLGERSSFTKKYLLNKISKRRVDFAGILSSVLFSPTDIDVIVDSPSHRRGFLDNILEQSDREYRIAIALYEKGLRQRNALLEAARETGRRNERQFEYWDHLLIENGSIVTQKRQECIEIINNSQKDIFDFVVIYDKSVISKDRLLQYKDAELGSGVTLVGPHRDDFSVNMLNNVRQQMHDVKYFGSRGQQRLVMVQLKVLELSFLEKTKGEKPLLLLDDIFSELDESHIHHLLELIGGQQTIITTTHEEFVDKKLLKNMVMIKLST